MIQDNSNESKYSNESLDSKDNVSNGSKDSKENGSKDNDYNGPNHYASNPCNLLMDYPCYSTKMNLTFEPSYASFNITSGNTDYRIYLVKCSKNLWTNFAMKLQVINENGIHLNSYQIPLIPMYSTFLGIWVIIGTSYYYSRKRTVSIDSPFHSSLL
jgi:hypothetical protein